MFVITRDYITNYTGNDDEIVEPIDCIRIFTEDFVKDFLEPLKNVEGGLTEDGHVTLKGVKAICSYQFRLYDDDDNLYYEGYYNGLDSEEMDAFEPLDWASSDSGCTTLRYRENGEWAEL